MSNTTEKLELRDVNGCVDYDLIVKLMAIEKIAFAAMLDCDLLTLERDRPASPQMLAVLSPYFRLLDALWEHFQGKVGSISKWLHDPNRDWLDLSAIEMIELKKMDKVVAYLISRLDNRSDLFNGEK